ncbi:hypothetical protein DFR50_109164 [Roseiarcus fermentans]|uniref:Uncharacterized protein n=1 Tax=Roseiarcus fermentans TaxID=1473586 RepID=A0A366FKA5_9HYPH|nr:hypothetical protein DFR50_109164 [Roseiarcus fermentans]
MAQVAVSGPLICKARVFVLAPPATAGVIKNPAGFAPTDPGSHAATDAAASRTPFPP